MAPGILSYGASLPWHHLQRAELGSAPLNLVGSCNVLRLAAAKMVRNERKDGDRGRASSPSRWPCRARPVPGGCRTTSATRWSPPSRTRRGSGPDELGQLAVHELESAMINGETIRIDGAIRMAPR